MDLLSQAPQRLLRRPGELLELDPLVPVRLARDGLAGPALPGGVDHRALREAVLASAAARVRAARDR
eukprot:3565247-Alexandrium_andersonii.AAC.1